MSEIKREQTAGGFTFTLPDRSQVFLVNDAYREFVEYATGGRDQYGRGRDQQEMLLNFQKYGVFVPTPEDFAAYRARRDALPTSVDVQDAQTGYAGVSTPKLFGDLHALMTELTVRSGKALTAKMMLEELRRRLVAAPSQLTATLLKEQTALEQAKKDLVEAQQQNAFAQNDAAKARRHADEYRTKALEDQQLIASLQHRIAALKEELPEEVTAGGRAIQL